jgi:tetratricopeptide (TPR) repeat protein
LRTQVRQANWTAALESLADATLDPAAITIAAVQQDVAFYKALANGRLAQSGTGDAAKARDDMEKFIADNPNSYHYFEAVEVLGDLYASSAEPAKAVPHYQKLSEAPWTDYKMRAFVATGKANMAAGNAEEANKQFDQALQLGQGMDADALVAAQLLAARLGKAAAMAKTGQAAEGITMVKEVIAKAPPEEKELHAAAYVTLGNCYVASGDTPENNKAALLAYLHVDVLYYAYGDYHAEALYNLAKLWQALKRPDRATEADQVLKSRYKNSAWARKT